VGVVLPSRPTAPDLVDFDGRRPPWRSVDLGLLFDLSGFAMAWGVR
jgi:hypothetical protein